ncbi:hypothetical protein GCM10009789_48570 [Kribbella sancticallisti]|uniref:Uncharacterized protein n=1 Tax=Kribbella sancticallisti TaxID=460087 RepID=A0ABP4PRX3_9ACTN
MEDLTECKQLLSPQRHPNRAAPAPATAEIPHPNWISGLIHPT